MLENTVQVVLALGRSVVRIQTDGPQRILEVLARDEGCAVGVRVVDQRGLDGFGTHALTIGAARALRISNKYGRGLSA